MCYELKETFHSKHLFIWEKMVAIQISKWKKFWMIAKHMQPTMKLLQVEARTKESFHLQQ